MDTETEVCVSTGILLTGNHRFWLLKHLKIEENMRYLLLLSFSLCAYAVEITTMITSDQLKKTTIEMARSNGLITSVADEEKLIEELAKNELSLGKITIPFAYVDEKKQASALVEYIKTRIQWFNSEGSILGVQFPLMIQPYLSKNIDTLTLAQLVVLHRMLCRCENELMKALAEQRKNAPDASDK